MNTQTPAIASRIFNGQVQFQVSRSTYTVASPNLKTSFGKQRVKRLERLFTALETKVGVKLHGVINLGSDGPDESKVFASLLVWRETEFGDTIFGEGPGNTFSMLHLHQYYNSKTEAMNAVLNFLEEAVKNQSVNLRKFGISQVPRWLRSA